MTHGEISVYAVSYRSRSGIRAWGPKPKRAISLRVDEDVLEWFRTSGPRYQTRMNAVLRSYVASMRRDRRKARAGSQ
ncbi:MAG: BrnA antitoxin family protein [Gemmatimonadota bacterium]